MAKVVYFCPRDPGPSQLSAEALQKLARRLTPDHIAATVRNITGEDGTTISIITPGDTVLVHGACVALGAIEQRSPPWWEIGTEAPEGTYAVVRGRPDTVEVLTDFVASRTIWYVHTEHVFIASTSQRAIVACLGSYEPNPKTYPWILSSGCLGPDLSWDRRIRSLPPNSRVVLDRRKWVLSERIAPTVFESHELSDEEHEKELTLALQASFDNLDLDLDRWVLSLSGGYDSRCALAMLENRSRLNCITWTNESSIESPTSDAFVARQLASSRGHKHEFFYLDSADEPVERLLDRRLTVNEGRIDHISAAMDGYARYKRMHEAGVAGLLRSDVGFSTQRPRTARDVRWGIGLMRLRDYANADELGREDFESQELPERFLRHGDESLATWRDRLYHDFRIPCVLAALAEPRLCYFEQANPQLTRRVMTQVRALPDHLRNDKKIVKRVVDRLVPGVPIARNTGISDSSSLLSRADMRDLFRDTLESTSSRSLMPSPLKDFTLRHLASDRGRSDGTRSAAALRVARSLPAPVKRVIRSGMLRFRKPSLEPSTVAFRCYTIVRMDGILREDARSLR